MSWWRRNLDLSAGEHSLRFSSEHPFKVRELRVTSDGQPLTLNFTEGELLKANGAVAFSFIAPGGTVEVSAWLNDAPDQDEMRRRYDLEVAAVDRAVGALIKDIERRGLDRETVIVLTSDHGEALGEHGQFGHVNTLYDEVLKVPLVIRPLSLRDRRALAVSSDRLVTHTDLAPTILELADVAPWKDMRGSSLISNSASRTLLAETHAPEAPRDLLCLRDEQTKLIYDPVAERFTCHDLVDDPAEERDVYAERAASLTAWERRLREHAALTSEAAPRHDASGHLAALGYAGD